MDIYHLIKKSFSLRKSHVQKLGLQAFRLVHDIADGFEGLTVDVYPQAFHCVFKQNFYKDKIPQLEKELLCIARVLWPKADVKFYWWDYSGRQVRPLLSPHLAMGRDGLSSEFVLEHDLKFEIHLGEDNHTGLFLDQRDNRQLIQSFAQNKKVLNLFCYTASFSLAALAGEASEVHSVDLSKKTLEWAKRNVELNRAVILSGVKRKEGSQIRSFTAAQDNKINIQNDKAFFYPEDSFEFLKKSSKRNEMFDVIICDPPTFSRSKKRVFSIEKNLEDLLEACLKVLSANGKLLFSLNTQRMSQSEFIDRVKNCCSCFGLQIEKILDPPFDFPKYKGEPHLKAGLIVKG